MDIKHNNEPDCAVKHICSSLWVKHVIELEKSAQTVIKNNAAQKTWI